jgi:hypothetical protein
MSNINPMWAISGLIPGLHSEKPATDSVSYGMFLDSSRRFPSAALRCVSNNRNACTLLLYPQHTAVRLPWTLLTVEITAGM